MEIDPVSLTLEELLQMDPLALHHLAQKSAGTLTRHHALLGRTLLAIERTGAYLEHGCSGGVHYAVTQLGIPIRKARLLLRVTRELENLPYLRFLANFGRIEWSKLREIVRVATVETEREWAHLCVDHTYAEIEDLVSRSQWGEIPADQPVPNAPRSQLCCNFDTNQMAVLERGLQAMCQQIGRALSMAEAIELLFAEKLAEQPMHDDPVLQKVRQEALKDLHWTDLINAETETQDTIEIVNPASRVPTKAQRRKILRRDGYCCAVPGCPNTLWLEIHHIIYYADGGQTKPDHPVHPLPQTPARRPPHRPQRRPARGAVPQPRRQRSPAAKNPGHRLLARLLVRLARRRRRASIFPSPRRSGRLSSSRSSARAGKLATSSREVILGMTKPRIQKGV